VRVTSLLDGREITEDAQDTPSFDGTILKITAVLRNSKIPHIASIQRASVISIGEGSRSFNMMARPAAAANQVRVTFTKE
jgi:hypothetical protein